MQYSIKILRAYRYRIYPTAEQAAFLNRQFGSVRYVYNWALALTMTTYQTQGQGITRFQLDKRLTALQHELPWLGEVAAQPLQQALVHLDKAFTRFFREKKGYPRFHSKRGKQSATYPQGVKFHWDNGVLYLPKAGWVRAVFSRRFPGTAKTVTVTRVSSGKFFASVLVEDESQIPAAVPESLERAVGGTSDSMTSWCFLRGNGMDIPNGWNLNCIASTSSSGDSPRRRRGPSTAPKFGGTLPDCLNGWRTGDRIVSTN